MEWRFWLVTTDQESCLEKQGFFYYDDFFDEVIFSEQEDFLFEKGY